MVGKSVLPPTLPRSFLAQRRELATSTVRAACISAEIGVSS